MSKGLRAMPDANPFFQSAVFKRQRLLSRIRLAPVASGRVAGIDKPSLYQDILKGLPGCWVQLMLSLLELKQDRAGPSAIGLFGGSNGCHRSPP
jgi:hypothetical protein